MTPTNYTEKARERRAADKRLRGAAPMLADAATAVVRAWETGHLAETVRDLADALKKAGVSL